MADSRPHPGQQLIGAEGLGQVVVGSQVQSGDLVLLVGPGGDHHHRQRGPAAKLAQNVQTVHIRQAQVQDHQVRTVRGDHGHGLGTVAGPHGLIAIGGENGGDEVGDALFILNDQDFFTDIHTVSSLERGRQKMNSAPSPVLRAVRCPPWALTMALQTDRPRPMLRLPSPVGPAEWRME